MLRCTIRRICFFTLIPGVIIAIRSLQELGIYLNNEDALNGHSLRSTDIFSKAGSSPSKHESLGITDNPLSDLACSIERMPRLIHQTFKTTDVPEEWIEPQRSCQNLHQSGWNYTFWTDESAQKFLVQHYPWFLETYLHYPYTIQRADAIRYFILYHFGGIYLDLDVGCKKELVPFLKYDALLPRTDRISVSNDVMASAAKHPFFERVIRNLRSSIHLPGMKYATVFLTTGPTFLTSQVVHYWQEQSAISSRNNKGGSEDISIPVNEPNSQQSCRETIGDVRIIPPEFYSSGENSFFAHYHGSSWHGTDAKLVKYMVQTKWVWLSGLGLLSILLGATYYLFQHSTAVKWTSIFHQDKSSRNDGEKGFLGIRPANFEAGAIFVMPEVMATAHPEQQ